MLKYIISPKIVQPLNRICNVGPTTVMNIYRRSYAIRHKQAKVYQSAYQKGSQEVGSLWGLVVRGDRSDYD